MNNAVEFQESGSTLHGPPTQSYMIMDLASYATPRMRTPCPAAAPGPSSMFLPWILLKKEPSDVYVGKSPP